MDNLGTFLYHVKAAMRGDTQAIAALAAAGSIKAAMNEGSGPTGGYLVPASLNASIYNVAAPISLVRPRAIKIPMTTRTVLLPFLNQTATPATGTSALIGNIALSWGTEGTSAETEPTFAQLTLVSNKLTGYSISSTGLDEDSAATMDVVMGQLFGRAVAWFEDRGALVGTGVDQMLGVLNAPCTISVNRNTSAHFKIQDVFAMLAKLHPNSINAGTPIWVVHPTVLPDIGALTGLQPQAPLTLAGYPVKVSEHCSVLGTAGDVLLCDFGHYVLGQHGEMAVAVSSHAKFTTYQDVYRLSYRIDGQPWLNNSITLLDGSNTVSPFVKLT